jgi:hypothetical protein
MRKLLGLFAFAVLAAAPGIVGAQSSMMSSATMASHAYDWMLGTWTCANSIPSPLAGPATQTLTATRSSTTGAIVWRYTGKGYDQYGFLSYAPKTATWWFSWAYPGGSVGNESSAQTGKKTVWTGMIFDASTGKHLHIRDTYTMYGATKFNDTGEDDSSGTMKTGYNGTCVKS